MRIVTRQLTKEILIATAFVMVSLLALFAFFDVAGQSSRIGTRYGIDMALQFAVLNLPRRFYQVMPIAALLGGIYTLSRWAAESQFVVWRISGLSAWRLALMLLAPASILIAIMSFYPMVRAFIISLQKGTGANMRFTGFSNYQRILVDKVFQQSIGNTFFYLIIQVPIMLILAILLAQLLNNKHLKLRGLFRTCVFLPCATSLVSYSLIFRSMFATDGLINSILMKLGILHSGYNFLGHSGSAKAVIILALIWRWTGYNMVFYLAGLQNIEYSVYEAAKIDGANGWKTFWRITVPLLKPTIIMTFIMSINGTLQLFDESVNLTKGGPANTTITMSHYVYNTCFINVPNFGYAAAMSFLIFIMVAILAFINLKVGDTRD